MQLEQTLGMYQPMQTQRTQERERVYTIVNLESMSASALYTGDSGSSGGFSYADLPAMNLQAHCHEGENGTTHFKTYGQEKIQMLDSYQFAIGDLYAKSLGLKTDFDSKK